MPGIKKRRITADDLYRFQTISGARVSPDGTQAIYAVQRVDPKTESKYANLWIVSTDGKSPARQYTYGDQKDTSPKWSPDGWWIAFLSNRGDREKPAQLYRIPTFGGEAQPVSALAGEIESFEWSPDGKKIVCVCRKTDASVVEQEKDEQKKKLGVVDRHYNRLFYKLDGYGYLPQERNHLWIIDIEKDSARQLTDHPVFDERSPSWSPDGKSIVFVSNRSQDPDASPDRHDLFVIPAKGGEMTRLETPVGQKISPVYSPDGKWIAFFAQEGEGLEYKNRNVWVIPTDGSSPARCLTSGYDLQATGWTINDLGGPEAMPPVWSKDGGTIYFQADYHGSALLESISVDGKDLQSIIAEGGVVINFSFDREQTRLVYTYGLMSDPGQIYVRDRSTGKDCCLTQVNRSLLDEIDLGLIEEVWFKGPDGNDLQGWVLKPPEFDPGKKYPSIMEIHGGPLTQYGKFFMHEFYFLAAADYVVYFCNPRGGLGYGEEHARAIWGDWGKNDYGDLMAWADHMAGQPYIDPQRMGVTGGSYGGFMTVWIIGHTDRFRAAVTQRCVSNFVSMWGSSDFNWYFQKELNDKAPFEDLKYYWDHSPIAYIGNARTPTLVIHNEMDLRCPIEQGEQVFVALKRLGVDTEFVRFPEEFHGLSRTGRTDRRISRLNHIKRWFEKYLKEE